MSNRTQCLGRRMPLCVRQAASNQKKGGDAVEGAYKPQNALNRKPFNRMTKNVSLIKTSEHDEQKALFQWAKWNEGRYPELKWLFAIPNGGYRHIATAVRLKASGVKKGVFDIMLPVARGGYHGLFIEMKVDKNKLTESQAEFQQFLIKQNYKASVCYSMEEAKDAIMRYLIGVKIGRAHV